jgi:gas vesicle protein
MKGMDVEKTMQFILEQTARNTVQIGELREMVLAHERDLQAHDRDLQVHTEWKTEMSQALQDLAGQMKNGFQVVAEKMAELAEAGKETRERLNELAEAGKETSDRLNILIRTVDDMIPRLPKQQ